MNVESIKHTPTPWLQEGTLVYRLNKGGTNEASLRAEVYPYSEPLAAILAHEVRSKLNAHDELVASLKAAREIVRATGAMESVASIDAVLRKAGEAA